MRYDTAELFSQTTVRDGVQLRSLTTAHRNQYLNSIWHETPHAAWGHGQLACCQGIDLLASGIAFEAVHTFAGPALGHVKLLAGVGLVSSVAPWIG